jgi:hypothetical protein
MATHERTPLLAGPLGEPVADDPQEELTVKPTPLPKLQFFCVCLIQFGEPITAIVVYPFIVQLVRDSTGADDARVGYYAGFIVSCIGTCEVSDLY